MRLLALLLCLVAGLCPAQVGPSSANSPGGYNTYLQINTSGAFGGYAGTSCSGGQVVSALDSTGRATCVTGGSQTVASGSISLSTSSISSQACASVQTATATGVTPTDVVLFTSNASLNSVTGYGATGSLTINGWPSSNQVNFDVCNLSVSSSVTPGAVTLNWRVVR